MIRPRRALRRFPSSSSFFRLFPPVPPVPPLPSVLSSPRPPPPAARCLPDTSTSLLAACGVCADFRSVCVRREPSAVGGRGAPASLSAPSSARTPPSLRVAGPAWRCPTLLLLLLLLLSSASPRAEPVSPPASPAPAPSVPSASPDPSPVGRRRRGACSRCSGVRRFGNTRAGGSSSILVGGPAALDRCFPSPHCWPGPRLARRVGELCWLRHMPWPRRMASPKLRRRAGDPSGSDGRVGGVVGGVSSASDRSADEEASVSLAEPLMVARTA